MRSEVGGHTTLWRGAPTETFREGYIPPADCQKNVFLPCCVCRGDHWSPASLPRQRIFRDSFLQGKRARAGNARPYKRFSAVCSCPTFPLPTVPNGCLFLPLDKRG